MTSTASRPPPPPTLLRNGGVRRLSHRSGVGPGLRSVRRSRGAAAARDQATPGRQGRDPGRRRRSRNSTACSTGIALPRDRADAVRAQWPGPRTWIVPATARVPRWITGTHTGVAVRVSDHPDVVALCDALRRPDRLDQRQPRRRAARLHASMRFRRRSWRWSTASGDGETGGLRAPDRHPRRRHRRRTARRLNRRSAPPLRPRTIGARCAHGPSIAHRRPPDRRPRGAGRARLRRARRHDLSLRRREGPPHAARYALRARARSRKRARWRARSTPRRANRQAAVATRRAKRADTQAASRDHLPRAAASAVRMRHARRRWSTPATPATAIRAGCRCGRWVIRSTRPGPHRLELSVSNGNIAISGFARPARHLADLRRRHLRARHVLHAAARRRVRTHARSPRRTPQALLQRAAQRTRCAARRGTQPQRAPGQRLRRPMTRAVWQACAHDTPRLVRPDRAPACALSPFAAHATTIYKCTDAKGTVTMQNDKPCAPGRSRKCARSANFPPPPAPHRAREKSRRRAGRRPGASFELVRGPASRRAACIGHSARRSQAPAALVRMQDLGSGDLSQRDRQARGALRVPEYRGPEWSRSGAGEACEIKRDTCTALDRKALCTAWQRRIDEAQFRMKYAATGDKAEREATTSASSLHSSTPRVADVSSETFGALGAYSHAMRG